MVELIRDFFLLKKHFFFFIILIALSEISATTLYENQKIHQIKIKGNKIVSKDAIQHKLKTKKGRRLKKDIIVKDVKNLFSIGYFDNIFVESKKTKKGHLIVTFHVKEKARIDSILYEGNKFVSKKKLEEFSKLKAYEFLDIKKLKKAIDGIKKGYEEKGYFLAQVSYRLEKTKSPQKVKLIIQIKEGNKILIKQINFIGNKNISDKKIKSYLFNKEQGLFSFFTGSGVYKKENLTKDIQVIRQIYFEHGYLEIKVTGPNISLSPNKDGLYISYTLSEGDVFLTGPIEFSGDLIIPKIELRKNLPLEIGEKLTYSRLQQSLKMIQTKYGNKGYAFANVTPRFAYQDNTVHILFDIQKGNPTHIQHINISGNHYTRDKTIRRMISIDEGSLYNASKVLNSKNSIQRLGYFEKVDILNKTLKDQDKKIDLEVSVKEREHFGNFQAGAGYGLSPGFFTNVDLNKTNLFGLGTKVGLFLNYIPKRAFLFNVNYTDPHLLDSNWYFGINLFTTKKLEKDVVGDFLARIPKTVKKWLKMKRKKTKKTSEEDNLAYYRKFLKNQLGIKLDFGRWFTDTIRVVSSFGIEKINFNISDPLIFDVDKAQGLRASINGILEYDNRDDRFIPNKGVFSHFSTKLSHQFPNKINPSSNKFIQIDYIFRLYKKWMWGIVWKNSIQIGSIHSLSGEPVPFDMLYLLGGPHSLRGFKEFAVGKRKHSAEGKSIPYGGIKQLFYNMEWRFPLAPRANLYGMAFFDIGYADDSISTILHNLKKNVGLGILIITPFGPINLRWGFPIRPDQKSEEKNYEFHFSLGSEF